MSEVSTQTLAARPALARPLPQPPCEVRQAGVAAAAADRVGFGVWRGLAFALATEGIVLWAVLATDGWLAWATSAFGLTLLALAAIDVDRFRLPDALTYPLLLAGLGTSYLVAPENLLQHLTGAAAGFLSFAAFRQIYFWLRGREGLGLGDAKLMAALGAWLSWQGLPSVVLIAALGALAVTLAHRASGRAVAWDHRLPFGAFLASGAWLVWLYGPVTIL